MDRKQELLQQHFGYNSFRQGQEELIDALLMGRDAFGIMPTGGGKSLCYQIPALLMEGITLVVSPLISLMKDQVMALKKAGIPAAYINSSLSPNQIRLVYDKLAEGQYKIIYIAPERLSSEGFLWAIRQVKLSMVAVDEAHCISQWGQDFRPSYLRIVDFLEELEQRPVLSAFTATATQQVREDVERILDLRDPLRIVTGFDRPNLRFEVLRPKGKKAALRELLTERKDKCGIIYCSTRKDVEAVCEDLRQSGFPAIRYHAGLSEEERQQNQEDFIFDRSPVMVATNAFGMGIDKSNVAYVIHYNMPQSIEAYYQEAGRAGRDGSPADCILLYSANDIRTAKFLIQNSGENEELSPQERRQIMEQDMERLNHMVAYCKTESCLRGHILTYFGQEHEEHCSSCGNCNSQLVEQDITLQAKMILSCIQRIVDKLGYPVGITLLIQCLRGSRDKRILELGLDSLSTYRLMSKVQQPELRQMVDGLELQAYIQIDPVHGGVTLCPKAREVLFHGEKVLLRLREKEAAIVEKITRPRKATAPNSPLLSALKELRFQIAQEERVPAYIIFSNAALEDMAEKQPLTMIDFLQVSGVGKYKAEHYGDRFLSVIKKFL